MSGNSLFQLIIIQITALRIAISFCQKGDYAEEASPRFDFSLFTQIIAKLLTFVTIPEQIRLCLKEVCVNVFVHLTVRNISRIPISRRIRTPPCLPLFKPKERW